MKTKSLFYLAVVIFSGCYFLVCTTVGAADTILHNFTDSTSDGAEPQGSLTLSGSKLYGVTSVGGAAPRGGGEEGDGVIFDMNTDGSGFTVLHSFTGGANDGALPSGSSSLTLSGSKLFGMTEFGGSANGGTIFSMNTDGSGFILLHSFTGGVNGVSTDGQGPIGSLTLSGSKLYGMTYEGGSSLLGGIIFSINTDGSGFTILHNFEYSFIGGFNDGEGPQGSLILVGSKLYGTTVNGGSDGSGAIFSINVDGTGFTLLHSFTGGYEGNPLNTSDGRSPSGSLTLAGSKLYGMTGLGGSNECGTIFSMNLDGSSFTLLRSFTGGFTGGSDDGAVPMGSLTLSGSKFYGMTGQGGSSGKGTVFSINIDGTGYRLLQSFSGQPNDGATPGWSDVLLSADGATLYGMTQFGGTVDDGVVFSIPTSSAASSTVASDFNGDGHPDYLLFNASSLQTAIWYMNGPTHTASAYGPTLPSGWTVTGVADFNGDGHPDYLLFNASSLQTAIWYMNGATHVSSVYGPTLPSGWAIAGVADFNGDGQPDFVLFNASTLQTAIWYMNGPTHVSSVYGPTLPAGWTVAGVADFNGDGKPDFVLFNASTLQTALWYMNGPTHVSSVYGPTLPAGWTVAGVADFNGDGKPDFVLFNAGTLQTGIWYLNGPMHVSSVYGPTLPSGWRLVAP